MFNFFLLLCLYFPFQVALNPVLGVDLASIRILILALFLSWIFIGIKDEKKLFYFNIQTKLILVFIFLGAVSLFFAQNYFWGLRKLLYLFSIFPLYFIARNILSTKEKRLKTIKRLVLSGMLVAIIGVVQFFSQLIWSHKEISNFYLKFIGPIFWGENLTQMVAEHSSWLVSISNQNYFRCISIFPDPHTFSLFLGMLLPLALILFLFFEKKKIWLVAFIFILIADILTFSRGAYFGIIIGIIVFVFIFWKKMETKYKLGIGIGMVLFFTLIVISPISQRFLSSFDLREGSNIGRIKMWEKSIKIIQQKPFFGTGLGNFSLKIIKDVSYRNPIYAHSTYLDVTAEEGILAGIVWISILFVTLRKFYFLSKKNPIYLGLTGSLIIFSTHSLVETGIYSPVVLTLFIILISFYPQYEKR